MEVENTLANLTKQVIVLENLEALHIQQLADARTALAAARVHVADYKNINRDTVTYALPNELLAAIFEAGSTDRPVFPQIQVVEFPITISHVSRHWREIALHTPSLWSTIHMDENTSYPKLLDAYLDRSGACPLDIVMDYQNRYPESRILFRETFYLHKILPHIDRWHSLWVGSKPRTLN
jgi:F-box-like